MKLVPEAIGRVIAHNTLLAQKASPGLLFGAGVVGMVGSTVLACRATLKVETILEGSKERLNLVRTTQHPDYSEEDRRRDTALVYFQTGVKVTKLYGPAIVVGGISIAALTSSHNILTKRNAALTAAYTALDRGFREYRARVVEKYGEEQDRNFRYGTQQVEVIDPETKKKKIVNRVPPDIPSIYARFFDEGSSSWNKEAEYNLMFLRSQQNYANDLLHARGHIFLNEVYDMLGIPRSEAGAVVGWVLTRDDSSDNHIDFGVFQGKSQTARDFVNGFEGSILLDFNVDGVIYHQIERPVEGLTWRRNKSLNK